MSARTTFENKTVWRWGSGSIGSRSQASNSPFPTGVMA